MFVDGDRLATGEDQRANTSLSSTLSIVAHKFFDTVGDEFVNRPKLDKTQKFDNNSSKFSKLTEQDAGYRIECRRGTP